jgi:hypothetical protein
MTNSTLIDRLQKLASHLYELDSGSGEAQLLSEAIEKIQTASVSIHLQKDVNKPETLIGRTLAPELRDVFNKWYAAYRDEWCKSESEYPDHLVASDAWMAAIEAVSKGITHYVQVGEFLLSLGVSHPSRVCIQIANDGDGGEFKQSDLEPFIKEFYAKHF